MSAVVIAFPRRGRIAAYQHPEVQALITDIKRASKSTREPKVAKKMHPRTHELLQRIARDMGARITVHGPADGWVA